MVPVSLEDEPDQFSLLKSEFLRAVAFADSALNLGAAAELRDIAAQLGFTLEESSEDGIEEDA